MEAVIVLGPGSRSSARAWPVWCWRCSPGARPRGSSGSWTRSCAQVAACGAAASRSGHPSSGRRPGPAVTPPPAPPPRSRVPPPPAPASPARARGRPSRRRAPRPPAPRPAAARGPRADFATNLGPKILVAAGALAFVVFLGLFVKYAWDNNWVGPAGRVLFGRGLRPRPARGRRPADAPRVPAARPGPGRRPASPALYTSAFGAHAFYGLVPREASGLLMVAVTVYAVLLAMTPGRAAARRPGLGGRLHDAAAALHGRGQGASRCSCTWPCSTWARCSSTTASRGRRRCPWPCSGTLVLYTGWYARFFTPERFEVAAFGLVLFTALFALGMARKERGAGLGMVFALAALGVAVLAAGRGPAAALARAVVRPRAAARPAPRPRAGRGLAAGGAVAAWRCPSWSGPRPTTAPRRSASPRPGWLAARSCSCLPRRGARGPRRAFLEPLALLGARASPPSGSVATDRPAAAPAGLPGRDGGGVRAGPPALGLVGGGGHGHAPPWPCSPGCDRFYRRTAPRRR